MDGDKVAPNENNSQNSRLQKSELKLNQFKQEYTDDKTSVITIQPIVYKEISNSALITSPIKKKRKKHKPSNVNRILYEGKDFPDLYNKIIYSPNVVPYTLENNVDFPYYYVANDFDASTIRSLFSRPVIDVIDNNKLKKDDNDDNRIESKPKSESQNKNEKKADEKSISELEFSINVKEKNNSIKHIQESTATNEILYPRKKYYLFHKENLDPDDDKLPTRSVCAYCCLRHFYGCPCYIWTIIFSLLLASIGIIIWLGSSTVYIQNLNKSYFALCSSNLDCDVNKLLHCAVENSACACPASISTGRCDCSPGYYWSGTTCSLLMKYGQKYCADDYNCDNKKFLRCINQTCDCGYQRQWNSALGQCDYVYKGCYTDNTAIATFQSQTARINYFVEICIDSCAKMKTNFALVSYNGAVNNCYCNNTFDQTTQTSCEIYCPGSNSNGRRCGSMSNNFNDKAVYKII